MNILFLTHTLGNGGTERMVCRLSNGLISRGHKIGIITTSDDRLSYELDKRIKVRYAGRGSRNVTQSRIKSIPFLRKYIQHNHIDIIACFIVSTIPFAELACAGLKNKPKIIGAERMNPKAMLRKQRSLLQPFIKKTDGFVFQTEGARALYPKVVQEKSTVIGNIASGVEIDSSIRKIPHSICSVGRLHYEKDFDTIIKAVRGVRDSIPDVTLHIYGNGPDRERLENLAEDERVSDAVVFEGFSEKMLTELQKYELFVFSSRAEGMPNALMEAMAAGLPCISTNCEFGPSELIEDGINGYLVPVVDVREMQDKILYLMENDTKRQEISIEASKIRMRYSENVIVSAYEEYFEKVVKEA